MKTVLLLFTTWLIQLSAFSQPMEKSQADWFQWSNMAPLPVSQGLSAGFAGLQGETMIYAGGSNFDKPRWEGGTKQYHKEVYVLENPGQPGSEWKKVGELPFPIADGATIETPEGLICIGGTDGQKMFSEVFLLRWLPNEKRIDIKTVFSNLPVACANPAAERLGAKLYVMGGKSADGKVLNSVWQLDLEKKEAWIVLPSIPGPARFGASLVRQSNGETDRLYLFSGKSDENYLTDAYEFNPSAKNESQYWRKLLDMPRPALLAPATAIGSSHIALFSGSDGHDLEKIPHITSTDDYQFTKEILAYHTITNTWTSVGQIPVGVVGSRALIYAQKVWIPGGEISPSVRTPLMQTGDLSSLTAKGSFGWLDYGAIAGYFLLISGISVYFSRRRKSSDQFLRGGQTIPFWAVGISVMATQVSAIGFMAIPAKSFAVNWAYIAGVATWFVVVPIVNWAFIPFYRKLNLTSAYQYLEERFDYKVRLVAATFFMLFQLGRMGLVLYLPAIAISAVTPIDTVSSIILMGLFSTVYTAFGGIEAVIWIEVAQALLLFGGALACFVLAVGGLEGGFSQFVEIGLMDQKFSLGSTEWSWTSTALGIILIGNIFNRLGNLTSDQAIVQRFMTTASLQEAKRSVWADVMASIPWAILIYALGVALYAFYKQSPQLLNPVLPTDSILPAFISLRAPAGVSGLIIAGVFAACMSTLESSIHSVATISLTDFYSRIRPNLPDKKKLFFLRVTTWILGAFATGISIGLLYMDVASMLDLFTKMIGLFTGAAMGLFFLGIFTKRANATGALAGVIGSGLVMAWITFFTSINFWLYSALGLAFCFGLGILISAFTKGRSNIRGLTIYSKDQPLHATQEEKSSTITVS